MEQTDLGFVEPSRYTHPDIICHRQGVPGKGHIRVAAGSVITLQWTDWPESHKGPVFDHLANCNGPCETVNKNNLRFFKIDGAGLTTPPSTYAGDVLIQNSDQWSVRIPANIRAGNYVLRHEILALHGGNQPNGAQSYPQCINLEITGSGSSNPSGTAGTALLNANDPGVVFNIHLPAQNYVVPGGPIVDGGVSMIPQSVVRATATGTVTPGGGGSPPTTPTGGGQPPQPTSNPPNPPSGGAPLWGQCGGNGWSGPTTCVSGATCRATNEWYSQCVPN